MMPQNYRPGLDVVRLAALLPVLCYHYCIEAARLGFAVPTALIGRGMADWVEVGLAWFFLLSGAALCMAVLAVVWPLVCPAPWEAGHTVLGRLPAFALGVWFGTLLKKNAFPSYRLYIGLAVCPLLWVDEVPRLAVLLVLASVLFWAVYAAGQHVPAPLCPALRRLAGWCYGVYLVHHVLLTLVFLPFVQGHGLPLAGMFPVYLAASFVPAAVLTAVSRPLGKAIKKLA